MLFTGVYHIKARPCQNNTTTPRDNEGNCRILMLGESQVKNILKTPAPYSPYSPYSPYAKYAKSPHPSITTQKTSSPKKPPIFKFAPNTNLPIIVFCQWQASPKTLLNCTWMDMLLKKRGYNPVWAAVDSASATKLRAVGLKSQALQANMFCREDIFKPLTGSNKSYDAIYCGALESYKRPWLAKDIKSLRIVARNYKQDLEQLAHQWEVNHAVLNKTWVKREELVKEINSSWCGLALSKKEGSMLAITDYLLCGIPVVTTPSTGGRDLWLTKNNHLVCKDNAPSVADTVARCKEKIMLGILDNQEQIAQTTRRIQNWERSKLATTCKEIFNLWVDRDSLKHGKYQFYKLQDKSWEKIDIKNNPNP